jgi:carbonic anhydrase
MKTSISMTKNNTDLSRLFLVCPDCFIEQKIRNKYGNNSFFLTALGTVFYIDSFEYAEEVNTFLSCKDIKELIIVNDTRCTFIKNTLGVKNNQTKVEQRLAELYLKNYDSFETIESKVDQRTHLEKLNIYRQVHELRQTAFLSSKIKNGDIEVKGLIYNRDMDEFTEITIDFSAE